jgi:hypothetical protein
MANYDAPTMMINASPTLQNNLFQELLSGNGKGLDWPAYPRTWVQKDLRTFQDTNTSMRFGIDFAGLSVIQKFSIAYTYSKKISFVAAGTADARLLPDVGPNQVTATPASGPALESLRRFDPASQRNYFKVDAKHPMIGFCAYELQLNITKSGETKAGFNSSFGGVENNNTNGEQMTETQTIYSKIFQIDPTIPEMDYLTVKCEEQFQGMVRAYAEVEFSKIMVEYKQVYGSECQEDAVCTAKYNAGPNYTNPLINVKGAVARCLQRTDATRSCYARATEGKACPLYKKKDGTLSEQYQGLYTEATSGTGELSCDTGLKCNLESNILGAKFAYCRKK